ncbi:MAG: RpiB/LacA/LacB family sugar-phosphate isomerase [Candidatus Woesearchaeota archaeon]
MHNKTIILGSDHAGFELKEAVKKFLIDSGFEVDDIGADSYNAGDDYPEFIYKAAKKVAENSGCKGIVFGGSGQGEAIVANKVPGIRAVVYYGSKIDIVKLSRTHNDTNILSLGARFVSKKEAIEAVNLWLETDFSKEERHKRRIKQITKIECK